MTNVVRALYVRATKHCVLCVFAGVFAGSLCDMFGCRVVALLGNAIAAVGLIIAAFATNYTVVFIAYGIMTGECVNSISLSAFTTPQKDIYYVAYPVGSILLSLLQTGSTSAEHSIINHSY
jgi:MFS family permease